MIFFYVFFYFIIFFYYFFFIVIIVLGIGSGSAGGGEDSLFAMRFAMVCASNMNRSMEAHRLAIEAGLCGK